MSESLRALLGLVARLRDPVAGCPWDLKQTHTSLAPFAIEEAYEMVDAIENGTPEDLRDELGDLLFQVVLHAQVASEAGEFDFDAVARTIVGKMTRRHPHLFAVSEQASASETWEELKRRERGGDGERHSALSGLAPGLPELLRAVKLQKRAALVGFDWQSPWLVVEKVAEELQEVVVELRKTEGQANGPTPELTSEIGDLLFACVNLARQAGVDPGNALRTANRKFESRFCAMEAFAEAEGVGFEQLSLREQEILWIRAKQQEDGDGSNRVS